MLRARQFTIAVVVLIGGIGITPDLGNDDSSESSTDDSSEFPEPRFEISWLRGELHLSGHTASRQQEQNLLQVAATSFPGRQVTTQFEPLGIVPEYWEDRTLKVLYALAPTASARAELTDNRISIRGVAIDGIDWQRRLDAFAATLPADVSLIRGTIAVEESNTGRLCSKAFAAFDAGPINFEESGTVFRSSALPRLERIVALANACRGAFISITGHTDASGSEWSNQKLSLKRAQAVADYIANAGIDLERLRVDGLGSTLPIADNTTRYGRGLNRRIEIDFETY